MIKSRNRSRSVILESDAPMSMMPDNSDVYDCSNNLVNSSVVYRSSPYRALKGYDESISDVVGNDSLPNPVMHSVRSYDVNREFCPAVLANDPPNGTAHHSDIRPYWMGTRVARVDNLKRWSLMDPLLTGYSLPWRWSIGSNTVKESILKEDVIERSVGLIADHALNLAESSQIWPSIKTMANLLPVIGYNWQDIRKLYRNFRTNKVGTTLRRSSQAASNTLLAYQFGIKPLLDDLVNTIKYASRLDADVKKKRNAEPTRVSRTATLPLLFDDSPETDFTINGVKCFETTYKGTMLGSPTIRYVLVTKPDAGYYSNAFALLSTLAQRFSSSPASFAWEKVPFSFVVDWFVDLRGACRAIDGLLGVKPLNIVSFTRSYSYELFSSCSQLGKTPCGGQALYDDLAGTVRFKHYERSVVTDEPTWPVWKPHFGKTQAAETAALITQQLQKIR